MYKLEEQKKVVLDFLSKELLGVVSTVHQDGNPEAAAVAFAENDNLELVFATFSNTRKYGNLKRNPYVAFVIGVSEEEGITVQYEGEARELYGMELAKAKEIHVRKDPERRAKYAEMDENKYFLVTPTWIRYLDIKTDPETIFEIRF